MSTADEPKRDGLAEAGPAQIVLIRHGQSAGNVAAELAHAENRPDIAIDADRDMDVPLSALGVRQAQSLAEWIAEQGAALRPAAIISSPYKRAHDTADAVYRKLAIPGLALVSDERLREREFGIVDRLTAMGIQNRFPDQAQFRAKLGKFYYRPPGGESWCDVILRVRSLYDSLKLDYSGERVFLVCHSVVILCFRYLLEHLTEKQILQIDSENEIGNCSFSAFRLRARSDAAVFEKQKYILEHFNNLHPVTDAGTRITSRADIPAGPK